MYLRSKFAAAILAACALAGCSPPLNAAEPAKSAVVPARDCPSHAAAGPDATVEVVLRIKEAPADGSAPPPPQVFCVPVRYLDPANPPLKLADRRLEAQALELFIPSENGRLVTEPLTRPVQRETVQRFVIVVTAPGWQRRTREIRPFRSPDHPKSAYSHTGKVVSDLELIWDDPAERIYLGVDAQYGVVDVVCWDRGPARPREYCRVFSELTPNLVLAVWMYEDELPTWKPRVAAARDLSLALMAKPVAHG